MRTVTLVDSGANYASVFGALERCGARVVLTHDPNVLRNAERVIVPGVGNVGDTWTRLERHGLVPILRRLTCPVLGICVGMQILFDHCDEAGIDTLGVFPGRVRRLRGGPRERVPHCGWNRVETVAGSPLIDALDDPGTDYAYFVHSFAAPVGVTTLATAWHGETFCAASRRGNFYGVQFHPERSARFGNAWLRAFLSL